MRKQEKVFNYRSVIEGRQVDYLAALRDSSFFNLYGIPAEVKIPKKENNLDEYINYVDDEWDIQKTVVVPKFTEYRSILSQLGQTAEDEYPLEILIPSGLHLPRNSRIILDEYNSHEDKIAREWRVLSTESKQLSNSKTYTRIAYCAPARASIYKTARVERNVTITEFEPISDYTILQEITASSVNYLNIVPVMNTKTKDKPVAESTNEFTWKVRLPSILH
jgi:hypothetical protein